MPNRLLLLAAASTLTVAAATCSDDDTTEMSSEPMVSATVESDATESDSTESDRAPATQDTAEGIVTGFARPWLPGDLDGLELSEANSIPVIDLAVADERVTPDHWVWDWWPVRDRSGEVADFDGWSVAIALSAPADVLPIGDVRRRDRHAVRLLHRSRCRVRPWGTVRDLGGRSDHRRRHDHPSGDRSDEPAGPSGGTIGDDISYRQRLAVATATMSVSDGEVQFADWSDHEVLLMLAHWFPNGLYW